MYIIGYKYKSANGFEITKAVVCKSYKEYKRVVDKINDTDGYELIDFDEVIGSEQIPQ